MARIRTVKPKRARPLVNVAYYFGRRQLGKLAGRSPERGIEPIEL